MPVYPGAIPDSNSYPAATCKFKPEGYLTHFGSLLTSCIVMAIHQARLLAATVTARNAQIRYGRALSAICLLPSVAVDRRYHAYQKINGQHRSNADQRFTLK